MRFALFAVVFMALNVSVAFAGEDGSFGVLEKVNREIALHWKKSGPGHSLENANLHLEAILKSAEASCAQQSYVFARNVMQKGFYARRIGLWSASGANDIMVEVSVDGAWSLFAPSTGAYYPFGISELMGNPKLASRYKGEVVTGSGYLSESFFGSLVKIDILSSFNDIEHNFVKDASIVSSENFYAHPNGPSAAIDGSQGTYAAGLEDQFPYWVDFIWKKKISVYRISFDWYSSSENSKDYEVYVDKGKGYELVKDGKSFVDYARGDYVLPGAVTIEKLRIKFKSAPGQRRVQLRELGIY